ncbi:MAG TPA: ACP S-malonyltransferase [Spirochaetota bacterium]|nr:ACP S-malonyltransferase [Spirochaetota bacterium]
MAKVFMFPGQGSQKVGMGGADLFDKYAELTRTADDILQYSLKELCLEGPADKLNNTFYTQPALFTVNAMLYKEAVAGGEKPAYCIGHSLGEYSAFWAAGAFDFKTGLTVVKKRGELMSQAAAGAMAAVIGLDSAAVKEILQSNNLSDSIQLANINSDIQNVISGDKQAVKDAESLFLQHNAKKYVILPVSGAFHSRYMQEIQQQFAAFLADFAFSDPDLPVIANVTARPCDKGKVKDMLVEQLTSPVRWVETINYLKGKGITDFTEIGPGAVLKGLLRRIK